VSDGPTLVLVEDHLALRRGLEMLLRSEGFSVIGVTDTAKEAHRMVGRRRPQVVVLDLDLRDGDGLELALTLAAGDRPPAVLVHTAAAATPRLLEQVLEAGVSGVALKTSTPHELISAIQTVASGGRYVDPVLARLAAIVPEEPVFVLSPRERRILTLLLHGASGAEAADALGVTIETVRTHVRNASRKLGARTRVNAVSEAVRRGEIVHDSPA